jgi:hypothetical protein
MGRRMSASWDAGAVLRAQCFLIGSRHHNVPVGSKWVAARAPSPNWWSKGVLRSSSSRPILRSRKSNTVADSRSRNESIDFQVADAHVLPFPDCSFDIVAHALVLNFVSDSHRAVGEMRRVGRSSSLVAGYVWDFASARAPNSCIALGLRRIDIAAPQMPGTDMSTLDSLKASFERAGLEDIRIRPFDVSVTFPDFDDFWHTQTPSFSPLTRIINGLTRANRMKLIDLVRGQLVFGLDGTVSCSARANAVKARVP